MGSPGVAGYCASKAAVIGLVRTAAKENPHVRMNCVAPGKFNNVHTLPCVSDSPVFLYPFHVSLPRNFSLSGFLHVALFLPMSDGGN